MLPRSFPAFAAALLVPLVAAASVGAPSAPTCHPSTFGVPTADFKNVSTQFCNKLANENFSFDDNMYGVEKSIVEFQFTPQHNATCNLYACSVSAAALAISCADINDTVYGSGSTEFGCGTYNFTISPQILPAPAASTSGVSVVMASGYMFVGVASAFAWFL